MEIATAIAEGETEILARVSQTPNPRRNSEEKLVDFMVTALRSRVNPAECLAPPSPATELYGKEHLISTQLLYELSPCFKLGFMAATTLYLNHEVSTHLDVFPVKNLGLSDDIRFRSFLDLEKKTKRETRW